jgi:maltooligosyltrehalose trehalohydrolase
VSDFKVWAPGAQKVNLVLDSGSDLSAFSSNRLQLNRSKGGWWDLSLPGEDERDYAFSIDGGELLPDPRSAWQPYGIHGPSRTFDHSKFVWHDRRWQPPPLPSAILYELHIGTFTQEGTFESAIPKLEHLVRLGITHVELMPVVEFPGTRGWGYDGVDLFAPHHGYGGPEGLKRFVDACHSKGLAVLLDVVYNHLGPDGNYLGCFGPYFTEKYSTPWGKAVNLDGPGSKEVRRFFCDNARMWLRDYHFDGLRLDAVDAIYDSSAIHFLEQLAAEIEELGIETGRHFDLIAENDLNDPRVVISVEAGGYGFDAQWNDDFHHALHTVLTGERLGYYSDFGKIEDLATALRKVYVYGGRESKYRQRIQGRPVLGLPAHRFVGFLQNHDQVGNRAKGERSSHLLNTRLLKIGAALILCSPFLPLLFQGEEYGASTPFLYFTDHGDPELAAAVSKGRREEFASFGSKSDDIPDPQQESSFTSSKLDWNELEQPPHGELLDWHRSLISLRRSTAALQEGSFDHLSVEFSESDSWLSLYRQSVAVICNFSPLHRTIPVRLSGRPVLSSNPTFTLTEQVVELPGESVLMLVADPLAAVDNGGPLIS